MTTGNIMTRRTKERLYKLVLNPPKGSKLEAAKNHGVDLMENIRRLAMTPAERVWEMEYALQRRQRRRKTTR